MKALIAMTALIAIALVLSACGGVGTEATARPALVQPQALPAEEAIAPIVVAPESGLAVITFGVRYDPATLEIPTPLTRFKRTFPEIAWGARLPRGVTAYFVTWSVARRSASGNETPVFSVEEPIDGPDVTVLANSGDLALLLGNKAGDYVMRYSDSNELLAEGSFTLVK
jgi:hypothetical protein